MKVERILIMAKNETGIIADITETLADDNINIKTLNTENLGKTGVIILTTDCLDKALHALKRAGFKAVTDDALVIRLRDEPGALAKVAAKFKQAGVGIRSLHILNCRAGYSTVALAADDRAKAEALLDSDSIV